MAEQPGSGRLDPEILAAYVDGRLPPEDRARVEAEIAADPETQEWLVSTIKAVDDIAAVPEPDEELAELVMVPRHRSVNRVPRQREETVVIARSYASPPRRHRLLLGGAGVVLATAAALLLVVRVQPAWWQQLWGAAADPRFAKLVAAVGEERYVEGRLSGGFKYGPLRSVTRGPGDLSNQNLALLAAAGELQKAVQEDPSAENLHAWGVAQLLLGDGNGAIASLRSSAKADGTSASAFSDLSAAYAAAAVARQSAEYWTLALEAADQALSIDPRSVEAQWNRILALDGLGLRERAIEAIGDYLAIDPASEWASAAQGRLQQLQSEAPRSRHWTPSDLPVLQSEDGAAAAFRTHPEAAFDWMLDVFSTYCRRDSDAASKAMLSASAHGFERALGDESFTALFSESAGCSNESWMAAFAHVEEGRKALTQEQPKAADLLSGVTRRTASAGWVALAAVASSIEARAEYRRRRYIGVDEVFQITVPDPGILPVLHGRTSFMRGLSQAVRGEYPQAITYFEQALESLERSQQHVEGGQLKAQLADMHDLLGSSATAWRYRNMALQSARRFASPALRRWVYSSTAALMRLRGLAAADVEFTRAAIEASDRGVSRVSALSATLDLVGVETRAGHLGAADRSLSKAEGQMTWFAGDARNTSLRARFLHERAKVELARGSTARALETLDEALGLTAADRRYQEAEYRLTRVTALTANGQLQDAAAELLNVLNLLETSRFTASLAEAPQARGFQDAVQPLVSALVHSGETLQALELSSAVRDHVLGLPITRDPLGGISRLRDHEAAIVFETSDADSISWLVKERQVSVARRSRSAVTTSIAALQLSLATADGPAFEGALRRLDEVLLGAHRAELTGTTRLLVVPDALVMSVPFAGMLAARGESHEESPAVVVCTSIQALPCAETPSQVSRFLGIAVPMAIPGYDLPALPQAGPEVVRIASLYSASDVHVAPGIASDLVLRQMAGATTIHIAAHALSNVETWRQSRLMLGKAERESISAQDAATLRFLPGTVVVLSACSTAAHAGDDRDPVSLAIGFVKAGASRVVGTVWQIPDDVAPELFVGLHHLLLDGLSPEEALRRLQHAWRGRALVQERMAALGLVAIAGGPGRTN